MLCYTVPYFEKYIETVVRSKLKPWEWEEKTFFLLLAKAGDGRAKWHTPWSRGSVSAIWLAKRRGCLLWAPGQDPWSGRTEIQSVFQLREQYPFLIRILSNVFNYSLCRWGSLRIPERFLTGVPARSRCNLDGNLGGNPGGTWRFSQREYM